MRVLHLVENFGAAGLESLVREMILQRNQRRVEYAGVCVLNRHGESGTALKAAGHEVIDLGWKRTGKRVLPAAMAIRKIIAARKIEIVHAHNFVPLLTAGPATFGSAASLVVTFHGFLDWQPYSRLAYPLLYCCADRIVVVSQAMQAHYRVPLFSAKRKITTIINGIDLSRFQGKGELDRSSLGLEESDFIIGSVGRLSPVKNQLMQIQACHRLKDAVPNLKLVLITGASPDSQGLTSRFQEKAEALGVKDRIHLLGFRQDVPQLLKLMDLFVLTSISEGTSLALLEAMAAGLPIVASDVGGNPCLVRHGRNGLLFPSNNVEELAEHIRYLYQNRQARIKMGSNAEEDALKYSLSNMVCSYETLYRKILAPESHRRRPA